LGFISTLESKCLLNEQVTISPNKGAFKLTGFSYLQYKCCKYFASLFLKYDLQNIKVGTQEKRLRFGYDWDKAHMCFGINQANTAAWGQFVGDTFLGLFYTGIANKKVGICSQMKGGNLNTLKHSLVYETNINGKSLKAKVDTD
jgi:hypothetical protein